MSWVVAWVLLGGCTGPACPPCDDEGIERVPVLVAETSLTPGQTLDSWTYREVRIPPDQVPEGAARSSAQVEGRPVQDAIHYGELIRMERLGGIGAGGASGLIGDGRRAVYLEGQRGLFANVGGVGDVTLVSSGQRPCVLAHGTVLAGYTHGAWVAVPAERLPMVLGDGAPWVVLRAPGEAEGGELCVAP